MLEVELGLYPFPVSADGLDADKQADGDLPGGISPADQLEHLHFPVREPVGR